MRAMSTRNYSYRSKDAPKEVEGNYATAELMAQPVSIRLIHILWAILATFTVPTQKHSVPIGGVV